MSAVATEQVTKDPNTVFVGRKPVMNYVIACLTLLHNGTREVVVRARGRSISRAVDVVQILTKRFATDVSVKGISIDTETVKNPANGRDRQISVINITVG